MVLGFRVVEVAFVRCLVWRIASILLHQNFASFLLEAQRQDLEQRAHEAKAFRLGCTHGPPLGITIPEPWQ